MTTAQDKLFMKIVDMDASSAESKELETQEQGIAQKIATNKKEIIALAIQ